MRRTRTATHSGKNIESHALPLPLSRSRADFIAVFDLQEVTGCNPQRGRRKKNRGLYQSWELGARVREAEKQEHDR